MKINKKFMSNEQPLKVEENKAPAQRSIIIQTDGQGFRVTKTECSALEMVTIFKSLYEKLKPN